MRILIFAILLCLATSCLKENSNYVKLTGPVNISQALIPDTSVNMENIQISARAMETNACWKNLRFVLSKVDDFEYELEAYGTYESYGNCPEMMVYNDTLIDFKPTKTGTYIFHVTKTPYKIENDTLIVR